MRKSVLISILIMLIAGAISYWYVRHTQQHCIAYYDKTGTKLLYKDCNQ